MRLVSEGIESEFSEPETELLEQYNIPILGMIDELKDPLTTVEDRMVIKEALSIILEDGGFWGETINAHSLSATDLKQKVLNLHHSI